MVVVVAIALAGGAWLVTSGDDSSGASDKKEPSEARILHEIPTPKAGKDPINVEGMWTTGRNFEMAGVERVIGYPLGDGSAQWEIPLGGEMCWTTPHISADGRTDANPRALGLGEKGAVLAHQETTLGGAVRRVDPRTHAKTRVLRAGAAGRDTEASAEAGGQVRYARGHLHLGQKLINVPDEPAEKNGPLAIVIGTT
ncbi:hypothetical protein [Streptomyces buecherae]|uniref:hypothetical protein n=1 Tax=Streptomyces buecherae TaxID=2763006 RepID=UPI001C25DC8E|nr:hypothetical protein [Streptomyces buecherae]